MLVLNAVRVRTERLVASILKAATGEGSRGGKGYRTKTGKWRYGEQHSTGAEDSRRSDLDHDLDKPRAGEGIPGSGVRHVHGMSPVAEQLARKHEEGMQQREAARKPGKSDADVRRTQTTITPFSGVSRAELTPERIERGRAVARQRGDQWFGYRAAKDQPYHTRLRTEGGTLDNPTGSLGESDASDWTKAHVLGPLDQCPPCRLMLKADHRISWANDPRADDQYAKSTPEPLMSRCSGCQQTKMTTATAGGARHCVGCAKPMAKAATTAAGQLAFALGHGEGSRGGKIIGHTKSGKAIYQHTGKSLAEHAHFSAGDHRDTASLAREHAAKAPATDHVGRLDFQAMAQHHDYAGHQRQAEETKRSLDAGAKRVDAVLPKAKPAWEAARAAYEAKHGTSKEIKDPNPPPVSKDWREQAARFQANHGTSAEPKTIGKTRTGKPIYDSFLHPSHKDFTPQDHRDAAAAATTGGRHRQGNLHAEKNEYGEWKRPARGVDDGTSRGEE